ncbi:hypothetical protein ACLMAJ_20305 [Nocardia sp. KC 131]|uniref:hypothetical protein n=1 Tax=Nocardia arseniciresistens TaxID=3392119 RepID=UPI00398E7127
MTASVAVPFTPVPVRGRITLPTVLDATGDRCAIEIALTAMLLAGVVTGGTVLARAPLPVSADVVRRTRHLIAETGAYVVSTASGLTATSRASAGELTPFRCVVPAATLPLYAVAAARAPETSVLTPLEAASDESTAACLRLGLRAADRRGRVHIEPGFDGPPTTIDHGGDLTVAMSALLLGLLRRGVRISDPTPLDARIPGFAAAWSGLLAADEFLLPGSSLVPSDYIVNAPNHRVRPAVRSAENARGTCSGTDRQLSQ